MFFIRIAFYVLVLAGLIYVGITAGGDPCNRCKLKYMNDTLSCREIINRTFAPLVMNPVDVQVPQYNFSDLRI